MRKETFQVLLSLVLSMVLFVALFLTTVTMTAEYIMAQAERGEGDVAGAAEAADAADAAKKFVRIDKPTVYQDLIGDGKTILMLVQRGTITFDCARGDVIRDVEIRNKTNQPQTVVIRGTNVRVDNLVLDGCTLHLDGLQNSTLTSLSVANSQNHGLVIDNATCNCEIDGTFKRNAGFGVFIDSAETRSIEIYGKPIEENKLGQVCVNAIDKNGSISLKGRLNSVPGNGPPLTVKSTEGKIHLQSFLDLRNASGTPDIVQNPPGQRAKIIGERQ